jgi:hypothetical protein
MDTEFDAVPELVPDWNRHLRLASEMHCTIAHRLTSHTHPTLPPFTSKTSRLVDSPLLSRLQGELWRSRPGPMSHFGGQASTSCTERHAAKPDPATPRPPRVAPELLFNDGPEARADCTAASAASSLVLSV